MIPLARKAKDAVASTAKCDKTIIIEDSLPYGSGNDSSETQVYPYMEEMARNFMEAPLPAEPPSAPVAAWFQIVKYAI